MFRVCFVAQSAAADHAARMRKLHERVVVLHDAGRRGGESLSLHATRFYVAEAEQL